MREQKTQINASSSDRMRLVWELSVSSTSTATWFRSSRFSSFAFEEMKSSWVLGFSGSRVLGFCVWSLCGV